jgi:hypothetical protein
VDISNLIKPAEASSANLPTHSLRNFLQLSLRRANFVNVWRYSALIKASAQALSEQKTLSVRWQGSSTQITYSLQTTHVRILNFSGSAY